MSILIGCMGASGGLLFRKIMIYFPHVFLDQNDFALLLTRRELFCNDKHKPFSNDSNA